MHSKAMPLFWIDAFSSRPFEGNPAAVVPFADWPEDALLQRIAFENGLSETAFVKRLGPGHHHLRWFTPTTEMDLCGHATLSTAFVLFTELGETAQEIVFESRSGPLRIRRTPENRIELDFPARPPADAPAPEGLASALGIRPLAVLKNTNNWFCVLENMEAVRLLRPDFKALSSIAPGRVIVTAPGDGSCDFVSRFFAPGVGIDEDPVTGSSHCALIPYWAKRLGKTRLVARQLSQRGGTLWCTDAGDRSLMAGEAVLYLRGEIRLP